MPDKRHTIKKANQLRSQLCEIREQVKALKAPLLLYLIDEAQEELSDILNQTEQRTVPPTKGELARYKRLLSSMCDEEECNDAWWLQQVCERYKLHPNAIFAGRRALKATTEAKAVYIYGLLTFYEMELKQVATAMKRDRTTVAYHRRMIADQRDHATDLDQWLQDMEDKIYVSRNIGPLSKLDKQAQIILLKQRR